MKNEIYDAMSLIDLISVAREKAHPSDNPSSENADLIDALADKLDRLMVISNKLYHCVGCGCGGHGPSCATCYDAEVEFIDFK